MLMLCRILRYNLYLIKLSLPKIKIIISLFTVICFFVVNVGYGWFYFDEDRERRIIGESYQGSWGSPSDLEDRERRPDADGALSASEPDGKPSDEAPEAESGLDLGELGQAPDSHETVETSDYESSIEMPTRDPDEDSVTIEREGQDDDSHIRAAGRADVRAEDVADVTIRPTDVGRAEETVESAVEEIHISVDETSGYSLFGWLNEYAHAPADTQRQMLADAGLPSENITVEIARASSDMAIKGTLELANGIFPTYEQSQRPSEIDAEAFQVAGEEALPESGPEKTAGQDPVEEVRQDTDKIRGPPDTQETHTQVQPKSAPQQETLAPKASEAQEPDTGFLGSIWNTVTSWLSSVWESIFGRNNVEPKETESIMFQGTRTLSAPPSYDSEEDRVSGASGVQKEGGFFTRVAEWFSGVVSAPLQWLERLFDSIGLDFLSDITQYFADYIENILEGIGLVADGILRGETDAILTGVALVALIVFTGGASLFSGGALVLTEMYQSGALEAVLAGDLAELEPILVTFVGMAIDLVAPALSSAISPLLGTVLRGSYTISNALSTIVGHGLTALVGYTAVGVITGNDFDESVDVGWQLAQDYGISAGLNQLINDIGIKIFGGDADVSPLHFAPGRPGDPVHSTDILNSYGPDGMRGMFGVQPPMRQNLLDPFSGSFTCPYAEAANSAIENIPGTSSILYQYVVGVVVNLIAQDIAGVHNKDTREALLSPLMPIFFTELGRHIEIVRVIGLVPEEGRRNLDPKLERYLPYLGAVNFLDTVSLQAGVINSAASLAQSYYTLTEKETPSWFQNVVGSNAVLSSVTGLFATASGTSRMASSYQGTQLGAFINHISLNAQLQQSINAVQINVLSSRIDSLEKEMASADEERKVGIEDQLSQLRARVRGLNKDYHSYTAVSSLASTLLSISNIKLDDDPLDIGHSTIGVAEEPVFIQEDREDVKVSLLRVIDNITEMLVAVDKMEAGVGMNELFFTSRWTAFLNAVTSTLMLGYEYARIEEQYYQLELERTGYSDYRREAAEDPEIDYWHSPFMSQVQADLKYGSYAQVAEIL